MTDWVLMALLTSTRPAPCCRMERYSFSGAMGVLRALEAKRYASPSWKWSLLGGIANLAVAVLAVVAGLLLRSTASLSYIYAATLFYSACVQLVSAFRKTAIVYIQ